MSVPTRHVLSQGPVLAALVRTAAAGLRQPADKAALETPTPEITATIRNAGQKSPALSSTEWFAAIVASTVKAPTATPAEIASCWLTLTSVVARLISLGVTSA